MNDSQIFTIAESPETRGGNDRINQQSSATLLDRAESRKTPDEVLIHSRMELSQERSTNSNSLENSPSQPLGLSNQPEPMFADDPKVLKILISRDPMPISGPVLLDQKRRVMWRNLCMLGKHHIECIVEMSLLKQRFYIVALDLFAQRYHVVDLWLQQAQKIVRACDNDLEKLMKMIDFKCGKMYLKHKEILIHYEKYMPEKVTKLLEHQESKKRLAPRNRPAHKHQHHSDNNQQEIKHRQKNVIQNP